MHRFRIQHWFRKRPSDADLREELETHLAMRADHDGTDESAARRRFGNVLQTEEAMRRVWIAEFFDTLMQDARFTWRSWTRHPGFALTAVLVLALGLGSSTAMFSALDRILFRPLPYADEDRLVHFGMTMPAFGGPTENRLIFRASRYETNWRPAPEPFTAVTTIAGLNNSCDITEQPYERLPCVRVESNFLETLGVRPALGRDFTPEDDARGAPPVVLISHALWTRRFGADPGAIGRAIEVDGRALPVIGVLPANFSMPAGEAEILQPQQLYPLPPGTMGEILTAVGRLKPGVTPEQARAAIAPIIERDAEGLPSMGEDSLQPGVVPLRDYLVGDATRVAWLLLGAVGGLLLIACVNVANLILARLAARNREFEVRSALGAGRGRLARLALTESLLLAVAGGSLGVLFAAAMLRLFVGLAPSSIPEISQAALDLRVFAVAGLLALAAGVAVGTWPALAILRSRALQYGSRATSGWAGAAHPRMRFTLVTVQIAVTVALLGGSALLLRTLWNQVAVPLGYQSEHVFTMRVLLNPAFYPPGSRDPFFARLLEHIGELPGTASATMTSDDFPGGQMSLSTGAAVDGQPTQLFGEGARLRGREASAGYFRTFRIPILQGRGFAESDRGGPPVVILSESAARLLFPGQNPIGHTVQRAYIKTDQSPELRWAEVVGVAADVHNVGPARAAEPEIYTVSENWGYMAAYAVFAIRTQASDAGAEAFMKQAVADLDPQIPVTVEPLDAEVARQTERPRFVAWLLSAFAGLALLLAAAGLYAVASYLVTQRTRDIGVRMALGAAPADISRQVVDEAGRWIAAGAVVGCGLAWAGTRAIEAQLYDVAANDPLSWLIALVVLAAALLLAVVRPAARAARVDPVAALRAD